MQQRHSLGQQQWLQLQRLRQQRRRRFDSEEARQLNKDIFEAIYFAAVTESCNQAEKFGPYESFPGSPMSKGLFQFDLWGVQPSDRWDWNSLRERVKKVGLRNSLLVAPMPTASTSQILGNNSAIANNQPVCHNVEFTNSHWCHTDRFAILDFQSDLWD